MGGEGSAEPVETTKTAEKGNCTSVLAFESPRVLVLEYSCHEIVFAVGKEKAAKKATGTILMTPPKSKYVVPQDLIEDPMLTQEKMKEFRETIQDVYKFTLVSPPSRFQTCCNVSVLTSFLFPDTCRTLTGEIREASLCRGWLEATACRGRKNPTGKIEENHT